MNRAGLIGFGRFGQLLYQQLSSRLELQVYDAIEEKRSSSGQIPFYSLEEICQNSWIILAVPVSSIETVCRNISPLLPRHTLVMDVCAVKKYPVEIMNRLLREDIQILGSHPLFGPDSVQDSLAGHLMILTPFRISHEKLNEIKHFWSQTGVKLIEMSADEQDRLMAWTLALTHFLGRSLNTLPLPETAVATRDYQNLIHLMKKINRDTLELFQDMHRYNPYTREMREALLHSMQQLKRELDQL